MPKKVISREGDFFVVKNPFGARQKVKSLVSLNIGDYCLTQQNIITDKLGNKEAEEILKILKKA